MNRRKTSGHEKLSTKRPDPIRESEYIYLKIKLKSFRFVEYISAKTPIQNGKESHMTVGLSYTALFSGV